MKFWEMEALVVVVLRSPHGERGLKYDIDCNCLYPDSSLPAWGAWIEIGSRLENY